MVHGYHDTQDRGFRPYAWSASKKELVELHDAGKRLLLGFENELSFYDAYDEDDQDRISDCITDELGDYVGTEHDGSVDSGFECVSQPMTLAAHVNSDWIDRLCDLAKENDVITRTHRNGLHVHISRDGLGQTVKAQDLAIAKMALMLERFESQFVRLARRDYTSTDWANRVRVAHSALHSDSLSECMKNTSGSRYHSINITNSKTVEFRIFADSADPSEIKATLELVHALARYAMTRTLNVIRDNPWSDFVAFVDSKNYKFLPEYMHRRMCRA